MPDDAPAVKQATTRGYGAEVILYNRRETTQEALAQKLKSERQLTFSFCADLLPDRNLGQLLTLNMDSRELLNK